MTIYLYFIFKNKTKTKTNYFNFKHAKNKINHTSQNIKDNENPVVLDKMDDVIHKLNVLLNRNGSQNTMEF